VRILVYEFVTGGGWYHVDDQQPPASLAREAEAMLRAVATDLAALDGVEVEILRDERQPACDVAGVLVHPVRSAADERRRLARQAAEADATLVIAPEFDGHLLDRVRRVERSGGRLLGPSSQVVALASDKQATAEHLARHGVPVPLGMPLAAGEELPRSFDYPAVLKPRDGAGSLGIRRINSPAEADQRAPRDSRLERYYPGAAASVACLCGENAIAVLEPCGQRLAERAFAYEGGWLPLDRALGARARRLALRAAAALPNPRGYLGFDLVLGGDPAGSGDVVVEINPRLTTSYVGLRAALASNLAGAMIEIAAGRTPELCWKLAPISFSPDGICTPAAERAGNS